MASMTGTLNFLPCLHRMRRVPQSCLEIGSLYEFSSDGGHFSQCQSLVGRVTGNSTRRESALQRIEQRGIAMLLGALPDQLRRDLVRGRQLCAARILYRLHVAYTNPEVGPRRPNF